MACSWSQLQAGASSQVLHMWFGCLHNERLAHSYLWLGSVARRLRSTKQESVRWQMFQSLSDVPYPSLGRRADLGLKELSLEAGEQSLPQLWTAPMVNGQTEHSASEGAFCTLWAA